MMKHAGDEGPQSLHGLYVAGREAAENNMDPEAAFDGAFGEWEMEQIQAVDAAELDVADADEADGDDADLDDADYDEADDEE